MTATARSTYTFRNPELEDEKRVYEAIRALEIADDGECDFTEEDMSITWRLHDLANSWIVETPGADVAGYAAIRVRHPTRLRTFSGVLPEHRGRGIGSHLLALTEERARALAREAPSGETVYLGQVVGPFNSDKADLLRRHEYEYARTFWKMGIELDAEPPEPELPEGIAFEPMRPGTEREIFDTSEEAFRDHWDHVPHEYDEWSAWMFGRESFDPSAWVIAYDGDEIAGSSLNFIEDDEAWVGILSVRRPWRKKGLGLALLRASFREFHRRGIPKAALGVDAENPTGATRLYERAGMHVVREETAYRKDVTAA